MPGVRLVPPRREHARAWAKWRDEPLSQRYNPLSPTSVVELERRLNVVASRFDDYHASEFRWMVEYGGEIIGTVAVSQPSWAMGYAEISYMLGQAYHGRGLGTQAVALMIEKAFRESDLVRLFATISVENLASQRLVEKLGFVQEGRLREHYLIQERRVDEFVYGLLRREWLAQQA